MVVFGAFPQLQQCLEAVSPDVVFVSADNVKLPGLSKDSDFDWSLHALPGEPKLLHQKRKHSAYNAKDGGERHRAHNLDRRVCT